MYLGSLRSRAFPLPIFAPTALPRARMRVLDFGGAVSAYVSRTVRRRWDWTVSGRAWSSGQCGGGEVSNAPESRCMKVFI